MYIYIYIYFYLYIYIYIICIYVYSRTYYFKTKFVLVTNKPTRGSRNDATIIDHVKTNHFLNNDMHSGIVTADN